MKKMFVGLCLLASTVAFGVECGDNIVDQEVHLSENLDCSSYEGFSALTLRGSSKLFGHGYKVIAPNASSVIYAEGDEIKIVGLELQGHSDGRGIQAYNVKKLVTAYNKSENMATGLDYYTEPDFACSGVVSYRNHLKNNNFAIRVSSPNCSWAPRIYRTDMSNSKVVAANIKANNIVVSGKHYNKYSGSESALNLRASNIALVKHINLKDSGIVGGQVFIHQTKTAIIYNAAFGNVSHTAVDMYEVEKVRVYGAHFANSDIGLRIANSSTSTDFKARYARSAGNASFGVLLTTQGDAEFTNIDIDHESNNFSDYVSLPY